MFVKNQGGILPQSYSYAPTHNNFADMLPLRICSCGEFFCERNYFTERQGMTQYLLIFTLDGEGELDYYGKKYTLPKDTAMLINCNIHQFYRTKNDYWHFYYAHFDGTAADALTNAVTGEERFAFPVKNGARMREILESILSLRNFALPSEYLQSGLYLGEIYKILIEEAEEAIAKATPVQKALTYIHQHYNEKIDLDALCQEALLSKFYFLRQFFRYTGNTPAEYLRAYRINRAQALLKTTDESVEQIAAETGYGNTSSFIRAFKGIAGCTPDKYRKM